MACDELDVIGPDGKRMRVVICCRGKRVSKCQVAGCRSTHTVLCDFPLVGSSKGRTCDRKLCDRHAHKQPVVDAHLRSAVDYCPAHAELVKQGVTP